jgi:hypothetical protein
MMEYGAIADDGGELDEFLTSARRVPRLGDEMAQAAANGQATATYWLGRYDRLAFERDAGGVPVERDPRRLLRAADAVYRASELDKLDRNAALQQLDAIIRNYADVLKSGPADGVEAESLDTKFLDIAAFNYEFAARMRVTLEGARPGAKLAPRPAGPLPTIHGRPGGPPKGGDGSKFEIVIPKRSDERNVNPEGGKGEERIRKG